VLVQQSINASAGSIKDLPPQLLAKLAVGQRVDVTIAKPVEAGELATVKVAGMLLELRAAAALQAGQKVQLELAMEEGKPVLKLVPASELAKGTVAVDTAIKAQHISLTTQAGLKAGQQLAVEIVKVLSDNRLLVQVVQEQQRSQPKLPTQQFDIDVSKITQRHQVGERLQMNIASVTPLSIQLQPVQAASREQRIANAIAQLMPNQSSPAQLKLLSTLSQNVNLPEPVRAELQQLIKQTMSHAEVTQPGRLKQAVESSGVLLESKLAKHAAGVTQDFKANLAGVLRAVETAVAQLKASGAAVTTEAALNKLPAQVLTALAASGRTPEQLLNVLLSHYRAPLLSPNQAGGLTAITNQEQALTLAQMLTKPLTLMSQATSAARVDMNMMELMSLFKEVEGVHQKLQLNQLMMLKEPESSTITASWLFDIPIKDKQNLDLIQMQIDQHKHQQFDEEDDVWSVKLCLDTQNLGPVQATVTLNNEDVKVIIRAEKDESAQLLTDHLPLLEQALAKVGATVSHTSCGVGSVASSLGESEVKHQAGSDTIVDVSV